MDLYSLMTVSFPVQDHEHQRIKAHPSPVCLLLELLFQLGRQADGRLLPFRLSRPAHLPSMPYSRKYSIGLPKKSATLPFPGIRFHRPMPLALDVLPRAYLDFSGHLLYTGCTGCCRSRVQKKGVLKLWRKQTRNWRLNYIRLSLFHRVTFIQAPTIKVLSSFHRSMIWFSRSKS
mgnify:CR=1 FL=1